MKRLALDSSLRPTSLALQQGDRVSVRVLADHQAGAENLVSEIKKMMTEAELKFSALDEIIVSTGPGPFIGLRVGLAAGIGIGLAAGVVVKSIPSFVALASFANPPTAHDIICVAQPARKNFTATQTFNQKLEPLSKLACLEDEAFVVAENTCRAPRTPPEPLAKRLLTLATTSAHLLQTDLAPIYPPQATIAPFYEVA